MMIFELPSKGSEGGLRFATLGSCRVRNPLAALSRQGELRRIAGGLQATHTAAEARQTLEIVFGERVIPTSLNSLIYNKPETPASERLFSLRHGVDVFLLEVSDAQQFSFGDIRLQQNFLWSNFVRPHGGALLPWYRRLCKGVQIDHGLIERSLQRLAKQGTAADEATETLLRGIRLERQGEAQITCDLSAMMTKVGGRWVILGPFLVPGARGGIMRDRRRLIGDLKIASAACGATFFDPSRFVRAHGRETALAADGADIYEYAEDFYPEVGRMLVMLARKGRWTKPRTAAAPPIRRSAQIPAARLVLADQVNDALISLHRRRLEDLGADESGLYDYYADLLAREALVGFREKTVLELISAYLPAYDSYAVLRAGVGELALLLAAAGKRVIAYEADPRRYRATEAAADHLAGQGLFKRRAIKVVLSATPRNDLKGASLGIGIDAVVAWAPDADPALLTSMAQFNALLIDLRRFLIRRDDGVQQAVAAEALAKLGFGLRRDYPADALSWFRRSGAKAAA